jgi:uncharacterized membrane protein
MKHWLILAILVTACTGSSSTGITASDITCPPDSTLTYESFGSAFLSDNCLSCHTSRDRPVLTTRAAVVVNSNKILDAAVMTTQMPADNSIALEERQLLGEWIACGAP